MQDQGFFVVHRKSFNHPLFDGDLFAWSAYQWLQGNVNWRPREVMHKGDLLHIDRGQMLASQAFLSEQWGVGAQRVKTMLKKLEKHNFIKISQASNHGANVITVCDYEDNQCQNDEVSQACNQALTKHQPATNHTLKKDNNLNKELLPSASEPTDQDQADFETRIGLLRKAGGKALNRTSGGLETLAEIDTMIASGADFQLDVVPTVRRISGKRRTGSIRSWGYFAEMVADARDKRLRTETKMRTSTKTQVRRQPEPLGYEVFEPEPIPVARAGDIWGDHAEH